MKVVNEIELYNLTDSVIQKYRNEAKNFRNIDMETLERRLTAIVLNARKLKIESEYDTKYKLSGCYIHVNEPLKLIIDIGWYDEEHSSWGEGKERINKLINTYLKLGLNQRGSKIIIQ